MAPARTRAWALLAGSLLVLTLAPSAQAAEAWASAEPVHPAPGATIHLVFVVNDSGLLEVAVERGVSCTLEGPGGSSSHPCAGSPQLVDVGVLPAGHAYAWDFAAPASPGTYTARLTRASLLALPGDGAAAEATFTVAKPADDPVSLDGSHPDAAGPAREASFFGLFALFGLGALGAGTSNSIPAADAARWLTSLAAGTGTLLVTLISIRLGGRP